MTWVEVRRQAAIVGRVVDAKTGRPVGGAQVEITAAPRAFELRRETRATQAGDRWDALAERPDRTRTAANGHFRFMDLPGGRYRLTVALPGAGNRYGTARATAVAPRAAADDVSPATVELALPPTALQGQVSRPDGSPAALAEVQLEGSGERTFADSRGRYLLTGLELGSRTVRVSAPGLRPATETARLSRAGKSHTLNVVLAPATG
jgi:hypothetical protein